MWIRDRASNEVVENSRKKPIPGSRPYQFVNKVKNTKKALDEWNRTLRKL